MTEALTNYAITGGVKREIRNMEQLWHACESGNHNICHGRQQYEGICPRTNVPVLVIQICNCECHNRQKRVAK